MRPLSKKTRYALFALEYLARLGSEVRALAAEIAVAQKLPPKFLEAILVELRRKGILDSKRGKGGGYRLRRAASDVSLGEVIRIFDGPLAPLRCASESSFVPCGECADVEHCATRAVIKQVRDGMAAVLDNTSLADLVARAPQTPRAPNMYFI